MYHMQKYIQSLDSAFLLLVISLASLGSCYIFFVLQPEMSASAQRQAKKDNPEREREATLTRDSTPTSVRVRVHTPHTYPRTKHPAQLRALENLRQVLPFDEV